MLIFDRIGFPDAHCFGSELLSVLHFAPAAITAIAYCLISMFWFFFYRKIPMNSKFRSVCHAMASIFITCGVHYAMFAINLYQSYHILGGVVQMFAAINSIVVVVRLIGIFLEEQ